VTSSFDPAFDRKYMKLMPTLSGYRDEGSKDLVITRDYATRHRPEPETTGPRTSLPLHELC
jgi:hypothetical protein